MVPKMAMQISASLNVDERSVLVRSTDTIPDTAHCVDQRIGLLAVDLAAQSPDIDVDDVGGGIEMQVPDMLQQHRARHDVAFVAHQVLEQLKFARQKLEIAAIAACDARHQVELEVAD